MIHKNIKNEQINTASWQLNTLECTAALIKTTQQNICIISIYRHATSTLPIANDIRTIQTICNQNNWCLIIGGDFNAKHPLWNSPSICTNGRALANWFQNNSAQQNLKIIAPNSYTYWKGTTTSFLDFYITTSTLWSTTPEAITSDFDSDHRALTITFALTHRLLDEPPHKFPNYKAADWDSFKTQLNNLIADINIPATYNLSTAEIDTLLGSICNAITTTMDRTIPFMSYNRSNTIALPQNILLIIRHKKMLRRSAAARSNTPHGALTRTQIRLLSKMINELINSLRAKSWTQTLNNVNVNNDTFKTIRTLCGKRHSDHIKAIKHNNTLHSQNDKIVHALGKHFEQTHKINANIGDPAFTDMVTNNINSFIMAPNATHRFNIQQPAHTVSRMQNWHLVSRKSLTAIIKSRANKRSCGPDNIPNIVIRKLSSQCIDKMVILFNNIYISAYIPAMWKHAHVIPVPKHGKPPDEPGSYRPIALTCAMSKLFEVAVKDIILRHCEDHDTLPADQFGFRSSRSTMQPLTIFKTKICEQLNIHTPTIACALDIQCAFDAVWSEGLIYKMKSTLQFPEHICRLIWHWITSRTFSVKSNKTMSEQFPVAAGVPQGGVLSALLYIIYTADLPTPPQHTHAINRLQYADDILLYVSAKHIINAQNRLNTYLDVIHQHFTKWKIRINPNKCEATVIVGRLKHCGSFIIKNHKQIALTINNTPIPLVNELKYLGVTFTSKNTHIAHINNIIRKLQMAFANLSPLLSKQNGLSSKIKLMCYKQLLRPIICYGFTAWSDISSFQMERLRKKERAYLRACANINRRSEPDAPSRYINNSRLYQLASIKRIDCVLVENALAFYHRPYIENPLMQQCKNFDLEYMNTTHLYNLPYHLYHLYNQNTLYTNSSLLHYHKRCITTHTNSLVYNVHQ